MARGDLAGSGKEALAFALKDIPAGVILTIRDTPGPSIRFSERGLRGLVTDDAGELRFIRSPDVIELPEKPGVGVTFVGKLS